LKPGKTDLTIPGNADMPGGYPDISVVVCTYNRAKFIGKALDCLARQTLPEAHFEIVIVDNKSTDNTARICRQFIETHPGLNARYYFEESKGLSFARNRGLRESRGLVITYIDDDAEAVPEFLRTVFDFMQENKDAIGLGGRVIPKYSESAEPAWMSSYLNGFVGKVDYGNVALLYKPPMKYPAGCNMTYKAAILREVGGFNNQLTFRSDDKHIYYLVSKISHEVYYLPAATVYHNIDNDRLSFSNFSKLFLKTGNEEKIRVRLEEGKMGILKKFVEFIAKTGASALLYVLYAIRGKEIKGRYIFFSQWFTLKGFLQSEVFIR
jgi:glucosyl-dolichyl phosphate glucuronosyltransferase